MNAPLAPPLRRHNEMENAMRSRQRKLIGAFAMVFFVIFYALAAMALAQVTALKVESTFLRLPIFAVLGMGWALPMIPLIRWMERRDD
jgi:hypothetical protein